jgi:hypothetical protein
LVLAAVLAVSGCVSSTTGPTAGEELDEMPVVLTSADYEGVPSFEALVTRSVAAVRAVAETSVQEDLDREPNPAPLPGTTTTFRVTQTLYGDIGQRVKVALSGGVVEGPDGPYLVESPESPQYEMGSEYLLILYPRSNTPGEYWTVGPAAGRYKIVNDRLATVAADHRGQSAEHPYEPSAVEMRMAGMRAADAVKQLQEQRRR